MVARIPARTLRRAVGHIPASKGPLPDIRKEDEIGLKTLWGSCRYLADSVKAVEPQDTEVPDNSNDAILTLLTCCPFYFAGPAIRAERPKKRLWP